MNKIVPKKSAPKDDAILQLKSVEKVFVQGGETLKVLKGATLSIAPGEIVALVGPSGSGKSTLLQISGLLDHPTRGQICLNGKDCQRLRDSQRAALRRSSIGFIYQYHHLLPEFSAFENIVLPQLIFGTPRKKAEKRASDLLKLMGLAERATHRPARLSGGEQQRVAIARAIANKPSLLLADEPTGNLDPEKSAQIFSELLTMVRKEKVGALIATHNLDLAKKMDRIISLKEGVLV